MLVRRCSWLQFSWRGEGGRKQKTGTVTQVACGGKGVSRVHYRRCRMWGHTRLLDAAAPGSPIAHRWRLYSRSA